MKVQFYVVSSPGLGHIYRSVALALELQKHGHTVALKTDTGTVADNIAKEYLSTALLDNPDWIVVDQAGAQNVGAIRPCRKSCYIGVVGDPMVDGIDVYERADLIVVQGIPPMGAPKKWLTGFEYAILDPQLISMRNSPRERAIFFYGSIWSDMDQWPEIVARELNIMVLDSKQPEGRFFRKDMAMCKYALTAWGMTALEACCLGIPQVTITHNPEGYRSASYLGSRGALVNHVYNDRFLADYAIMGLRMLISDAAIYQKMSLTAMKLVDGLGCQRVADEIERRS